LPWLVAASSQRSSHGKSWARNRFPARSYSRFDGSRARTCDLGINSPAGITAGRCLLTKRAATTRHRCCVERQLIATRGDNPVLQSVLRGATPGPSAVGRLRVRLGEAVAFGLSGRVFDLARVVLCRLGGRVCCYASILAMLASSWRFPTAGGE
jgi:hypothetical protein